MKTPSVLTACLFGCLSLVQHGLTAEVSVAPLRPPSVPLVACDPYFSVWSPHDQLNAGDTTHWTGKPHRLGCVVSIDGKEHLVMGAPRDGMDAMPQTCLEVLPTRTIYGFEGSGVRLQLTFTTPALPDDLDLLSRPVTYVTYDASATDGKGHDVNVTFTASGELTVNDPGQQVLAEVAKEVRGLTVLRAGSKAQKVLGKAGDDLRIDWGYLYLAAPSPAKAEVVGGGMPSLRLDLDLGTVDSKGVSKWLMLAYDDLYSIQYMKNNLRPYWRRNGWEAADLLKASATEYEKIVERCEAFDRELMADVTAAGGEPYARICALAYRQCFAAGKFVADSAGKPLQFCKENHSNGCIATSDVFYPMAPQFLLFGPTLTKSMLVPFMNYAASERWKFPFAPHDLGTYPHANGQRYGGGEKTEENQMPVEESGNLLLLFGALAEMEGNADFAGLYWPQLSKWAAYLKEKGFDPENQLCTDDFAGHLAHNVNLSAKAICALGAFAKLCDMRGEKALSAEYAKLARDFAARWTKEAAEGDHTRLAFDRPGTWSQKYNLVWDRLLGLELFPEDLIAREMAFYIRTQNTYGLPLDNRKEYTKLDWILWTATLTRKRADFDALVAPVARFIQETPDRSPLTDWYETKSGKKVGFTARPVIGGVFLQMLYQKDIWNKYASRDRAKASGWAPMPKAPVVKVLVPGSDQAPSEWKYSLEAPAEEWSRSGFDDSSWRQGTGGFGTRGTPGARIGTVWDGRAIWLRREMELPAGVDLSKLHLWLHHDDDVQVHLNGVLAFESAGFTADYETFPIRKEALAALKPGGKVLVAIHCRQDYGGQYIDAGFAEVSPVK
jgi:Domain of unknown function (DUF4965)/Domain of unknown function (DUF1793)/Domain of unknown function (DUF5127)/Domain of unknown function (DUF4964)